MRRMIAGLVFVATLPALAQESGAPAASEQNAGFAALDKNRDGWLSKAEVAGDRELAKRFERFDANRDGRLSQDEYVKAKDDQSRQFLADSAITSKLKSKFLLEKGIPSTAISVETYEGRVQLSGFVDQAEVVARAGRIAAGVEGVKTVQNNLRVK